MHDRTFLRGRRAAILIAALAGLVLACSSPTPDQTPREPAPRTTTPSAEPVGFVNRVWSVHESASVAPGQLYVFLSEGTLVIAASSGTPSFGTWMYEGGRLTMVEEGQPYEAEILQLEANAFGVRIHNPGEPVEIHFVPADVPPVVLARASE